MKTTARKTASKLPFNVPAPVGKALKVAAKDLRKTGQSFAKDPRAFVEDVMESGLDLGKKLRANAGKVGDDVQNRVQKAGAEAARRAEGVAKNLAETVGAAVEKALHSLNVPTRKELRSLSAKVDGLGKKIDSLKSRKAPRATRRAR